MLPVIYSPIAEKYFKKLKKCLVPRNAWYQAPSYQVIKERPNR